MYLIIIFIALILLSFFYIGPWGFALVAVFMIGLLFSESDERGGRVE